jgi:hypothetical protein
VSYGEGNHDTGSRFIQRGVCQMRPSLLRNAQMRLLRFDGDRLREKVESSIK